MRSLLIFTVLLHAIFILALPAHAQTVNISGLSTLNLPSFSGSGNSSTEDDVCVYNSNNADYSISASGSGTGGAFTLASGGSTVAYHPFFRDTVGSGSFVELQNVNQNYDFTDASTTSLTCADSGGVNATVRIVANEADMLNANSGSYSGSVTLVVAPR